MLILVVYFCLSSYATCMDYTKPIENQDGLLKLLSLMQEKREAVRLSCEEIEKVLFEGLKQSPVPQKATVQKATLLKLLKKEKRDEWRHHYLYTCPLRNSFWTIVPRPNGFSCHYYHCYKENQLGSHEKAEIELAEYKKKIMVKENEWYFPASYSPQYLMQFIVTYKLHKFTDEQMDYYEKLPPVPNEKNYQELQNIILSAGRQLEKSLVK